jgi:hypothetical protein
MTIEDNIAATLRAAENHDAELRQVHADHNRLMAKQNARLEAMGSTLFESEASLENTLHIRVISEIKAKRQQAIAAFEEKKLMLHEVSANQAEAPKSKRRAGKKGKSPPPPPAPSS